MTDSEDTTWKEQRTNSDDYGPETPCSQCGEEIDAYSPEWTEYCHRHAHKRSNPLIAELEQLADEWEDFATGNLDWNTYNEGIHEGHMACALELRNLIQEYRGDSDAE